MLEEGPDDIQLEMKKSIVNLPFKLKKESISDTFNAVLDTLMQRDIIHIEEYNIDLNLQKLGAAHIEIEGRQVLIDFPLRLLAEKKTFLQKIEVEGDLKISLISEIDIDDHWNLTSDTDLVDYVWINKPEVKMGVFSLPIERMMNIMIERSKEKLIQSIDEAVRTKVPLADNVSNVVGLLNRQISIDDKNDLQLKIELDSIGVTDALNGPDWTEGILRLSGNTHVTEEIKSAVTNRPSPSFAWIDSMEADPQSELYFNLDMPLDQLSTLAKSKFVGRKFVEGGQEITINNIELRGLDAKLGLIADVTGSYDGQIFISMIPVFDAETKSFEGKEVELSLITKNVLHKALGWMLQGRIKKELEKSMQFSLTQLVKPIQDQINLQLENLNKEDILQLSAEILDINIEAFRFSKHKIHGIIYVPLVLEAQIFDLSNMNKDVRGRQNLD